MNIKENTKPYGDKISSGTSDSVLASLFRTVLDELDINIHRFNILINRYMIKANIPINSEEVSSARGNLKKELLKSTMTWKVFIKGLLFINVKKFDIKITLYHANGSITNHNKTVVLDQNEDLTNVD